MDYSEHAKLIVDLGGGSHIARQLSEAHNTEYSPQMVNMWKKRGVPWRFRGSMMVLAHEANVELPDNFLGLTGAEE